MRSAPIEPSVSPPYYMHQHLDASSMRSVRHQRGGFDMKIQSLPGNLFPRALFTSVVLWAAVACTEAKAHKAENTLAAPIVYYANVSRHDLPLYIEAVGSLD